MAKPGTHGSIDWDAVYTAHGQNFLQNEPVDNYFVGTPTLAYLGGDPTNGNDGSTVNGKYIVCPLIHTKQTNVDSANRLEQGSLAMTDPVTAAEYTLKQYRTFVTISAFDERQASGMDARLNLVETYIKNAKMSAEDLLSEHLFATSQGETKDIVPLPVLISTDGTGTVGNINASTYTFWKNKFYDTVTFSSAGLDKMRSMLNDISAGNQGKKPGMIVTTQAIYEAYMDLAEQALLLNTPPTKAGQRVADLGFNVAYYQGVPITWDPKCVSGRMYFLNKEGVQVRRTPWELSKFQPLTAAGISGRVAELSCWVATTVTHRRILGQISTIT